MYVALDEGCNTTCHSEHCGNIAEDKLKSLGINFSRKSQDGKPFTGLGANATTTGCRVLPFALMLEKIISGILESHQVKQGKTLLLLSLYSQLALGLVTSNMLLMEQAYQFTNVPQ